MAESNCLGLRLGLPFCAVAAMGDGLRGNNAPVPDRSSPTMFAPALLLALAAAPPEEAEAPDPPAVAWYLKEGDLSGGLAALSVRANEQAPEVPRGQDVQAPNERFSVGLLRFLTGVERLGRFLHAKGAHSDVLGLPFVRLPVPNNPEPEPVTYAQWRQVRIDMLADFAAAERDLSLVQDGVKMRLNLAEIRLDLDGDGKGSLKESLPHLIGQRQLAQLTGGTRRGNVNDSVASFPDLVVEFDDADVQWLRGYCDLLSAMLEMSLAYDASRWFDHCAHLIFADPAGGEAFLTGRNRGNFSPGNIADWVTAIHLVDFPLLDAERLPKARGHLLGMIEHSRAMWEKIDAETDDGPEWVPGSDQTNFVGARLTADQRDQWLTFLTEAEALLNGEKLAPFWRSYPDAAPRGLNLKRVFEEPRRFDLVLWAQGTAAVPYVEDSTDEKPLTDPQVWRQLQQTFRGNFVGYAVWIN